MPKNCRGLGFLETVYNTSSKVTLRTFYTAFQKSMILQWPIDMTGGLSSVSIQSANRQSPRCGAKWDPTVKLADLGAPQADTVLSFTIIKSTSRIQIWYNSIINISHTPISPYGHQYPHLIPCAPRASTQNRILIRSAVLQDKGI